MFIDHLLIISRNLVLQCSLQSSVVEEGDYEVLLPKKQGNRNTNIFSYSFVPLRNDYVISIPGSYIRVPSCFVFVYFTAYRLPLKNRSITPYPWIMGYKFVPLSRMLQGGSKQLRGTQQNRSTPSWEIHPCMHNAFFVIKGDMKWISKGLTKLYEKCEILITKSTRNYWHKCLNLVFRFKLDFYR